MTDSAIYEAATIAGRSPTLAASAPAGTSARILPTANNATITAAVAKLPPRAVVDTASIGIIAPTPISNNSVGRYTPASNARSETAAL